MPLPFCRIGQRDAPCTGTRTPKSGVTTSRPNSGWYRASSGCATSATQAGISSGRVVSISTRPAAVAAAARPTEARRTGCGGTRRAARDPRARPARRPSGNRRPRASAPRPGRPGRAQQAEERELRHALGPPADRRVGHRPVDRQAQVLPEMLERLLVLGRQPVAELDEIRPRDRDRLLRRACPAA